MTNILKDWKTTLAGIIVAGLAVATALNYITPEVANKIMALAVAFGLVIAKDSTK
jgi:ATP-dependent protease ClpP protease subunit